MATPLYIADAHRVNGIVSLKVVGHGLTVAHQGQPITITGAGHPSLNGRFTISRVVAPDMLTFAQDAGNLPGLAGGAVAIG